MQADEFSEIWYLAATIYGEARGEGRESKEAVAWVIRNRVRQPRWPSTYRQVVTQRLQFSCWNDNDPNRLKLAKPGLRGDHRAWLECVDVAMAVYYADESTNPLPGVNHYFDVSIRPPTWAKVMERVKYDPAPKFEFYKG